jgi:Carbohydrate esterase, sialic acid-specific acetylesterase
MGSTQNHAAKEGLRARLGLVRAIHLSAFDTYENVDLNRGSCNEWRERVLVSRAEVFQGHTAVMLIFGQSNAANSGAAPYTPQRRVFNFNLFDGNCYVARDPLLGATELRGNFATRMADMLIERGAFDSILLAPISVGGSRIEDWTTGGVRHRRLQVAIRRAMDRGISFTHVLWHQGESNAGPDANEDVYVACFQDIRAALRAYGVVAPIYVAQASVCRAPPNDIIRSAQRALVNPALGIFSGPDTDTIGPEDRFDDCHMAKSGLIKHAQFWTEILLAAENERATEKSDRTCQSVRMHQVATGPDSS